MKDLNTVCGKQNLYLYICNLKYMEQNYLFGNLGELNLIRNTAELGVRGRSWHRAKQNRHEKDLGVTAVALFSCLIWNVEGTLSVVLQSLSFVSILYVYFKAIRWRSSYFLFTVLRKKHVKAWKFCEKSRVFEWIFNLIIIN